MKSCELKLFRRVQIETPGAMITFFNHQERGGARIRIVQNNDGCRDITGAFFVFERYIAPALEITELDRSFPKKVRFSSGATSALLEIDELEWALIQCVFKQLPDDRKPTLKVGPFADLEVENAD